MAIEIIVRRRRNSKRPPATDLPDKSDPPEDTKKDDPPANDNDGAWPFIPFPEGWELAAGRLSGFSQGSISR